jgi:hypothetical protein
MIFHSSALPFIDFFLSTTPYWGPELAGVNQAKSDPGLQEHSSVVMKTPLSTPFLPITTSLKCRTATYELSGFADLVGHK